MAKRTLKGVSPNAQYNITERITEAKQLRPSDSGKLFYITRQASDNFVINLPKLSDVKPGWHIQLVQSNKATNPTVSGFWSIVTYGTLSKDGTAGTVDDEKVVLFRVSSDTTTYDDSCEGAAFNADEGNMCYVETDGDLWFFTCFSDSAPAVVNG